MTTLDEIFKKLSVGNLELSSEKIELGAVQDLSDKLKNMKGLASDAKFDIDEGKRFLEMQKQISNYLNFAKRRLDSISSAVQGIGSSELVVTKQAKELGIDESKIPQINESKQMRELLSKYEKELSQILNSFK